MSVALGGFDAAVAQYFFDIVMLHARIHHGRGKTVPQVVHAKVIQLRGSSDLVPREENLHKGLSSLRVGEQVFTVLGECGLPRLERQGRPKDSEECAFFDRF